MTDTTSTNPPALIATLVAALKSGGTATYRQTRERLADYGIRITTAAGIVPESTRLNASNP